MNTNVRPSLLLARELPDCYRPLWQSNLPWVGLSRAKREVTRFQRSAHFMTGELTRRCQTALREAKGQPVTADEIAVTAMREKNSDMGDGALRQDITRRFMWTLTRMLKAGSVTKQGYGAGARWALPETGSS